MVESGLQAVFLENRAALLRFLRARGAGDGAEDLAQELWIRASSAATGPIRDPLAYLYRTANNLMLDRRRAELRAGRRDDDWLQARPGDTPSHEQALIARQQLQEADAVLAALGARTDEIFRKFRLGGMTQVEIASELGISLSAVEKHLQKAYRALIELRRRFDAG
jgi:RNA polymerase sigma-70 factor (ECF subfamily)